MVVIIKFFYFKEFVVFKVRKSIDDLSFIFKGYEKVKSILRERYGNDSKVEKVYVKDILELSKISGDRF